MQRDDFIDTADMVLTKEIQVINALTKQKEKKFTEIENIRVEIENEQRRIEKLKSLQPKLIRKIQEEHEVGVDYTQQIDDITYLTQQDRNKHQEYDQKYYTPLIGKFKGSIKH